jgi:hypothetical protein
VPGTGVQARTERDRVEAKGPTTTRRGQSMRPFRTGRRHQTPGSLRQHRKGRRQALIGLPARLRVLFDKHLSWRSGGVTVSVCTPLPDLYTHA